MTKFALVSAILTLSCILSLPVKGEFQLDIPSESALFTPEQGEKLLESVRGRYVTQNYTRGNDTPPSNKDGTMPYTQTGLTSTDNLVKYANYAGAAAKVSGTSWDCETNCNTEFTKDTVVDYHWDKGFPSSYGYVAHNSRAKEIIVAFRGSSSVLDWIEDLTFVPVAWPSAIASSAVHLGFLSAYSSAAPEIQDAVGRLVDENPEYKISITGHSFGAAQAIIAAVDLATMNPGWKPRMQVYTYGEPRVGNSAFSSWIDTQEFPVFRVVNKGDLVPQVPFREMGFRHHAQEVWYSISGGIVFCGSDGESPKCQDSLNPLQWRAGDHLTYPGM